MRNQLVRYYLAGCLVLLLGLALFFRDILFHWPVDSLWASDIDTPLMYWTVSWGYHILFEARTPAFFFHSNAFFPQSHTLAYSDSLLGLQVLFAPMRLMGLDTLPALYLSLALLVLCAGLLTLSAVRRINQELSPLECSFLLYGSFFALSVSNYLIHYQLFGLYAIPPFLLFLFLFLRDQRLGDLAILCAIYVIGVSISLYLAPMLLVYSLFLASVVIFYQIKARGWAYLQGFIHWQAALIIPGAAAILYFLQIQPYLLVSGQPSTDTIERVIIFSATPLGLLKNISAFSFWYHPDSVVPGSWESACFPGYVLLALGLAFLIQTLIRSRRERKYGCEPGSTKDELLSAYLLVFFIISWLLSLGPYLKYQPDAAYHIRLPFFYLMKIIPGLEHVRSPGRFAMFVGFPLTFLGLAFLRNLRLRVPVYQSLLVLISLLLAFESLPQYPLYSFNPDPQGQYGWLSSQIQPGQPVLELPLSTVAEDGYDQYVIAMQQLVGSTLHWGRIAAGYGARETIEYQLLKEIDLKIQAGSAVPEDILRQARQLGFDFILVRLTDYSALQKQSWQDLASHCTVSQYSLPKFILVDVQSCH